MFAAILQTPESSSELSRRLCTAEVRGSNPLGSTPRNGPTVGKTKENRQGHPQTNAMQPYCNALLEVDVEAGDVRTGAREAEDNGLAEPRSCLRDDGAPAVEKIRARSTVSRLRGSLRQTNCAAMVSAPDPMGDCLSRESLCKAGRSTECSAVSWKCPRVRRRIKKVEEEAFTGQCTRLLLRSFAGTLKM